MAAIHLHTPITAIEEEAIAEWGAWTSRTRVYLEASEDSPVNTLELSAAERATLDRIITRQIVELSDQKDRDLTTSNDIENLIKLAKKLDQQAPLK